MGHFPETISFWFRAGSIHVAWWRDARWVCYTLFWWRPTVRFVMLLFPLWFLRWPLGLGSLPRNCSSDPNRSWWGRPNRRWRIERYSTILELRPFGYRLWSNWRGEQLISDGCPRYTWSCCVRLHRRWCWGPIRWWRLQWYWGCLCH